MNMKIKAILFSLLTLISFTRCIQDEPLNPEADILEFKLPDGIALSAPEERRGSNNVTNMTITVKPGFDLSALVPEIKITAGATIAPDPAVPQDFTQPVDYTVTAEDGVHQRTYRIQLVNNSIFSYTFERWELNSDPLRQYETPAEADGNGEIRYPWASSNQGVAIYKASTDPKNYPVHATEQSKTGRYAAEMETMKGPGNILDIQYIPVVAGSLFTGTMNVLNALNDPLTATRFGIPFNHKPLVFKGYYKYKAGTGDYIGPDGNVRPGVKDSCAVYAVFYKTDAKLQTLDGTNVLIHPNIVALAMMPPEMRAGSPGNGFVEFTIPFVYKEGVELDFEKNEYKLAVVFTSSYYGDHYEGTPGSVLVVDDVKILIDEDL